MPERDTLENEIDRWQRAAGTSEKIHFRYHHHFLHPGLMRRFLVRVGSLYREAALYWRNGVLLDAKQDQAVAEVICRPRKDGGPSMGEIEVIVQGPGRMALLTRLRNELERQHDAGAKFVQLASLDGADWIDVADLDKFKLVGKIVTTTRNVLDIAPFLGLLHRDPESRLQAPPAEASPQRTVYLSYAWKDATASGARREEIVDAVCECLPWHGYGVGRDKGRLQYKSNITDFMREIGRGACVAAVVSDKYLRSEYCMFEMFEVFRQEDVHKRLCVILLPDAQIGSVGSRLDYVTYWKNYATAATAKANQIGLEYLDRDGSIEVVQRITAIAQQADKFLSFIAEHVQLTQEQAMRDDFSALRRAIAEAFQSEMPGRR